MLNWTMVRSSVAFGFSTMLCHRSGVPVKYTVCSLEQHLPIDPAFAVSDLFRRADLQTLTLFDHLNKS